MSRAPIVTKRKIRRARRRRDFREHGAPIVLGMFEVADAAARFARYDYTPPAPDPACDHSRLCFVMSRWGAST